MFDLLRLPAILLRARDIFRLVRAGGKVAQGVREHGVEEKIWTVEGRGNGGMEETA